MNAILGEITALANSMPRIKQSGGNQIFNKLITVDNALKELHAKGLELASVAKNKPKFDREVKTLRDEHTALKQAVIVALKASGQAIVRCETSYSKSHGNQARRILNPVFIKAGNEVGLSQAIIKMYT